MTTIEEFDANKAFPFKSGSFVGNIIGSAIAVVLFYAVILMRLGSIEHDPWWLQTINFLILIAAGCAYFLPSYVGIICWHPAGVHPSILLILTLPDEMVRR